MFPWDVLKGFFYKTIKVVKFYRAEVFILIHTTFFFRIKHVPIMMRSIQLLHTQECVIISISQRIKKFL